MQQVGALVELHAPIGRHGQAELFQGVRAVGMRVVLVHQGDGVVEQWRISLHQADDARVERLHLAVGQPARLK
ncbi:hypothetical protein D3C76_1815590 [compost metagenome]